MIKAIAVVNGRTTLLLGLSVENFGRMMADKPIAVDVQAMFAMPEPRPIQDVVLIAGEFEEAMVQALREAGWPIPQDVEEGTVYRNPAPWPVEGKT